MEPEAHHVIIQILNHWRIVAWVILTGASMAGAFFYTKKALLPRIQDRIMSLEGKATTIENRLAGYNDLMTCRRCEELREDCIMIRNGRREGLEASLKNIEERLDATLKCVQKSEQERKNGQIVLYGFISAAKEKLDLKFDIPDGFLSTR